MPNWVFNTLSVSGDKVSLDAMREQLNKPVTKNYPETNFNQETQKWENTPATQHYSNPVFSFWNVIAPTNLEAYYASDTRDENESFIEGFNRRLAKDDNWYWWNVRNWGTKWDVAVSDGAQYSDTSLEVLDENTLLYRFNTAWSPPVEVIDALASMYPALSFSFEYEEETGWGGEIVWNEGVEVSRSEYDIPSSHQDYADLGKDCNCDHNDDPTWWFADCPIDTDKYELVDNEWTEKSSV